MRHDAGVEDDQASPHRIRSEVPIAQFLRADHFVEARQDHPHCGAARGNGKSLTRDGCDACGRPYQRDDDPGSAQDQSGFGLEAVAPIAVRAVFALENGLDDAELGNL